MADQKKEATGNRNQKSETQLQQFHNWATKHHPAIEVAVTAANAAIDGAVFGFFVDVLKQTFSTGFSVETPAEGVKLNRKSLVPALRWESARDFAVLDGVNAGLSCTLKKLTGQDNVHTSIVAGFGAGVAMALVSGMKGRDVVSNGALFAVCNLLCWQFQDEREKRMSTWFKS